MCRKNKSHSQKHLDLKPYKKSVEFNSLQFGILILFFDENKPFVVGAEKGRKVCVNLLIVYKNKK